MPKWVASSTYSTDQPGTALAIATVCEPCGVQWSDTTQSIRRLVMPATSAWHSGCPSISTRNVPAAADSFLTRTIAANGTRS